MTLNKQQRRVHAYLRKHLHKALPSRSHMELELGIAGSTIESMLTAFQRKGLIQIESWRVRPNGTPQLRILRYWAPEPEDRELTMEKRGETLAEATKR